MKTAIKTRQPAILAAIRLLLSLDLRDRSHEKVMCALPTSPGRADWAARHPSKRLHLENAGFHDENSRSFKHTECHSSRRCPRDPRCTIRRVGVLAGGLYPTAGR